MMSSIPPTPPVALTIAATDPTGGGGLQGDVITLASMGCHPLSVVSAVCLRDTEDVADLLPLSAAMLAKQARLLLEDVAVRAFKVGVLATPENIAATAEILSDYPGVPVVVESELGRLPSAALANDRLMAVHCELLLPLATVLVVAQAEAQRLAMVLAGQDELPDVPSAIERLCSSGVGYVLLTGSATPGPQVVNLLYSREGVVRTDPWSRLPDRYLGAGNTLSAALTGALAHEMSIADAVGEAEAFTWQSLAGAFRPGMGKSLPDRFFWLREGRADDGPA
ncbi:MAG: hydroxymethylpyrimidine/phosphomethylpyrimidine kinase [Zoogloeaceae bacterium]|nr:hydroxymethylpyrimidine/phosphomethylpyrimidine kinase [Zoogloeaceae bacterium]